jgi:hypothetical protein
MERKPYLNYVGDEKWRRWHRISCNESVVMRSIQLLARILCALIADT